MTRAADYAVRAMVHLASLPDGSRAGLADLATGVDVSPAFLSKVLQRLVKAGLIRSWRGKRGGFELSREVASVSLLDVLHALDSVPTLNACLAPDGCARSATCGAHVVWLEAQRQLRGVLAGASLARIARLSGPAPNYGDAPRTARRPVDKARRPRISGIRGYPLDSGTPTYNASRAVCPPRAGLRPPGNVAPSAPFSPLDSGRGALSAVEGRLESRAGPCTRLLDRYGLRPENVAPSASAYARQASMRATARPRHSCARSHAQRRRAVLLARPSEGSARPASAKSSAPRRCPGLPE